MSIDIEILPTVEKRLCWGDIKESIQQYSNQLLLSDLTLIDCQTNKVLADEDTVELDRGYLFRGEEITTLTLSIIEKDDADNDDIFIKDFGVNLSQEQRGKLLKLWSKVTHTILISSGANRSPAESTVLPFVGAGVAKTCQGWVVVSEKGCFDRGKGIYSSEEFARVNCTI
jgi:hypothetical protein